MRDPGTGLGGSSDDTPTGDTPPTEPEFYLQWGKENAKDSIKNATAALSQLLTLSTALLGGSVASWNYMPLDVGYKFAVVAVLLATVLVCLFAAMPGEDRMLLDSASDIRDHMRHVLAFKKRRLRIAKWCLAVALGCLIVGLGVKAYLGVPLAELSR